MFSPFRRREMLSRSLPAAKYLFTVIVRSVGKSYHEWKSCDMGLDGGCVVLHLVPLVGSMKIITEQKWPRVPVPVQKCVSSRMWRA